MQKLESWKGLVMLEEQKGGQFSFVVVNEGERSRCSDSILRARERLGRILNRRMTYHLYFKSITLTGDTVGIQTLFGEEQEGRHTDL